MVEVILTAARSTKHKILKAFSFKSWTLDPRDAQQYRCARMTRPMVVSQSACDAGVCDIRYR